MLRQGLLALAMLSQPAFAGDLPKPISFYQDAANAKDIDAYMSCFTADAEMTDVSRAHTGQDAIRAWALREVTAKGIFRQRENLERGAGTCEDRRELAELEHLLHIRWVDEGKITRMSFQYAN